ncbi:MAG: 2-oxoacid:acceptor oxidoreductase family protein [Armatimonadetes bacterium]|nr:2-oxoacid:acceptor oxidoreductase family protein [Armatimonadota bacterium]
MSDVRSLLLVGVGGQGVILAGTIVASACLRAGMDVKKSEVHGMAQRGGAVYSHIRYGPRVHSPLVEEGGADVLVAFEWAEGLRWLPYLRDGGVLIINTEAVVPPAACRDRRGWTPGYPEVDVARLRGRAGEVLACNARALARRLKHQKVANTILLGVLASRLDLPDAAWQEAIAATVPASTVEINLRAYQEGRRLTFPRDTAPVDGSRRPVQARPSSRDGATAFLIDVVDGWCKGCDICVRVCPEHCLRLNGRERVEVIDAAACTGCRLCEWLCPDFAIAVRGVAPVLPDTARRTE